MQIISKFTHVMKSLF